MGELRGALGEHMATEWKGPRRDNTLCVRRTVSFALSRALVPGDQRGTTVRKTRRLFPSSPVAPPEMVNNSRKVSDCWNYVTSSHRLLFESESRDYLHSYQSVCFNREANKLSLPVTWRDVMRPVVKRFEIFSRSASLFESIVKWRKKWILQNPVSSSWDAGCNKFLRAFGNVACSNCSIAKSWLLSISPSVCAFISQFDLNALSCTSLTWNLSTLERWNSAKQHVAVSDFWNSSTRVRSKTKENRDLKIDVRNVWANFLCSLYMKNATALECFLLRS